MVMERTLIAIVLSLLVFSTSQTPWMKRRIFIEKTTVIYARPRDIFRVLSNVEDWCQWTPSITGMSLLDSDIPAPGVRIKVLQPKLPPATWTITEVDRDRALVWEKASFGLR